MIATAEPRGAASGAHADPRAPGPTHLRVWEIGLPIAASLSLLALLYRPWGERLKTPFIYGGDAFHIAMLIKSMSFGWDYKNDPLVGAPYSASNYDFPIGGDRLHLVMLKVIARSVHNPLIVLNVYFLLCFVLITLSAYVVLRVLRFSVVLSLTAAVLFAFSPYHFLHGPSHLFLSGYYSVPLLVYLIVWSTREDRVDLRLRRIREVLRRPQTWGLMTCVVVGGSASSYYAIFGMMLIGLVGVCSALRAGSAKFLVRPAVLIVALGSMLAISLSPEILWNIRRGDNPEAAERSVSDSEVYGLHLVQLITPDPGHRIEQFSDVGSQARSVPAPGESGTYIGIAAVIGLAFVAVARMRETSARSADEDSRVRHAVGAAAIGVFVIGTVGGIGMVIAVLGFTEIRAWGRISVFLLFLGLVGLMDMCRAARTRLGRRSPLALIGLPVLLVIGLLDQIPQRVGFDYARNNRRQSLDRRLAADMDAALDDGAMVFQVPITPYPEGGPVYDMADYDHFRMPLADDGTLRWSYGGIRGRDTDWQARWGTQPVPAFLAGLAAAGFQALYVDRFGFADHATAYEAEVRAVVGPPVEEDESGRLVWYDLRPLSARERSMWGPALADQFGRAVTRRVSLWDLGDRPYDGRFESGDTLDVRNEGNAPVRVRLTFSVRTTSGQPISVSVEHGSRNVISEPGGPQSIEVEAQPGSNEIKLTTTASRLPGGNPYDDLALDGLSLTDVELTNMLTTLDLAAVTSGA